MSIAIMLYDCFMGPSSVRQTKQKFRTKQLFEWADLTLKRQLLDDDNVNIPFLPIVNVIR